jgi:hypothetical protein
MCARWARLRPPHLYGGGWRRLLAPARRRPSTLIKRSISTTCSAKDSFGCPPSSQGPLKACSLPTTSDLSLRRESLSVWHLVAPKGRWHPVAPDDAYLYIVILKNNSKPGRPNGGRAGQAPQARGDRILRSQRASEWYRRWLSEPRSSTARGSHEFKFMVVYLVLDSDSIRYRQTVSRVNGHLSPDSAHNIRTPSDATSVASPAAFVACNSKGGRRSK